MATLILCDVCKKPISTNAGQAAFILSSQSTNPKRKFVLSPKNLYNPSFRFEICESCAKSVHKYIVSIREK